LNFVSIVESIVAPQLVLDGEIDLAVAEELRAAGTRAVAALSPGVPLELDLGGVTFIDSSGLGALISLRNAAKSAGSSLVLVNISPPIVRLLELTGLRATFTIVPDPT
jgi:anti-anti-sigma factor